MMQIFKYRLFASLLLVVFVVHTVGVPVVVYSCPMVGDAPVCGMCTEGSGKGESVSTTFDSSCCETVILAERNTTQFIQAGKELPQLPAAALLVVSPSSIPDNGLVRKAFLFTEFSPGMPHDLPVFNSSLLL